MTHIGLKWYGILLRFSGLLTVTIRILDIMDGGKITGEGQMRAPPFFADMHPDADDRDWNVIAAFAYLIGAMFGAIHLIGWNFYFRSPIERNIWRIASIMTTVIPANGLLAAIFEVIIAKDNAFLSKVSILFSVLSFLPIPLYFPIRFILLAQAFMSLWDLPPPALVVIDWTSFIPHL